MEFDTPALKYTFYTGTREAPVTKASTSANDSECVNDGDMQ